MLYFFVSIIDIGTLVVYNHFLNDIELAGIQLEIRVVQIIFTGLFCFILLKRKFHRHQVTAIGFVVLGLVLVSLPNFLINPTTLGVLLISYLAAGFQEVLEKTIMDSKYVSPFRLLFYEGIIEIILGIISLSVLSLKQDDTFEYTIEHFKQILIPFWITLALL